MPTCSPLRSGRRDVSPGPARHDAAHHPTGRIPPPGSWTSARPRRAAPARRALQPNPVPYQDTVEGLRARPAHPQRRRGDPPSRLVDATRPTSAPSRTTPPGAAHPAGDEGWLTPRIARPRGEADPPSPNRTGLAATAGIGRYLGKGRDSGYCSPSRKRPTVSASPAPTRSISSPEASSPRSASGSCAGSGSTTSNGTCPPCDDDAGRRGGHRLTLRASWSRTGDVDQLSPQQRAAATSLASAPPVEASCGCRTRRDPGSSHCRAGAGPATACAATSCSRSRRSSIDSYADGLSLRQIAELTDRTWSDIRAHPAYRRSPATTRRRPTPATTRPMIIQGPRRPQGRQLRRTCRPGTLPMAATLVPAMASRAPWRRPNRTRRGIHGTGSAAAGGTGQQPWGAADGVHRVGGVRTARGHLERGSPVSINKDQSGRWHGATCPGLANHGRRDRCHVSGRRRDDVQRKVRELERRRDEGVGSVTGRQVTVDSWLQHWLDTIAAPKVRPSTLRRDRGLAQPLDMVQPVHRSPVMHETSPDPSRPTTPSSTKIEPNPATSAEAGRSVQVSAVAGCSVFSRRRQADR